MEDISPERLLSEFNARKKREEAKRGGNNEEGPSSSQQMPEGFDPPTDEETEDGGDGSAPSTSTKQGELVILTDEELAAMDGVDLKAQLLVAEEQLKKMKPQMASIIEFKLKVCDDRF